MLLREERKRHGGLTQKELAEKVGVSDITVGNWERGRTVPSIEKWKAVADALGVSMQEIEFKAK